MTNKFPLRIFTTHRKWALFLFSLIILLFFSNASLGILRTILVIAAVMIGIAHRILYKRNPTDTTKQLQLKQGLVLILLVTLASATSSVLKTLTAPAEPVQPTATAQPHKHAPGVAKAISSAPSSSSSSSSTSSQVTAAMVATPPTSSSSTTTTSTDADPDTAAASASTSAPSTSSSSQDMSDRVATDSGGVIADVNSHIYHLSGQKKYHIKPENVVRFATEADAQAAGYRRAKR